MGKDWGIRMKAKICDKCKSVEHVWNHFTVRYIQTSIDKHETRGKKEKIDLCEKCAEEIYKELKGRNFNRRYIREKEDDCID